jgi:transposase
MAIAGAFDIHRRQITFDFADTETGQVQRGRIAPATRVVLRDWLGQFGRDDVTFTIEGCTGWRFVVEELQAAGITALLAEPAETAHQRGPKKRAKTDKADARRLRELVVDGRVPLSWIPPEQACELRTLLQLYRDLAQEQMGWAQRIHATLFHHGVPSLAQAVDVALGRIDDLDSQITPLRRQISAAAGRPCPQR